jgi:hypothetical protein
MNTDAVSDGQARLARARLVREARAMARLAHPNVIHVYDVGTVEDGVFIAMELVEGVSLDVWLAAEPRPWTEILRRFAEAGRGLAAAHDAELVHRDFKPENVLLGDDGRVRVCDFGLAGGPASETTVPDSDPADSGRHGELDEGEIAGTLTRTGALLGPPKYMAPEQEIGGDVTALSDQFSFCVALYEALYGQPPFAGKTITEYRDNVRSGRLVPPPTDPRIPHWVHETLLRGIEVDPTVRHPDMTALLDRLEDAWRPRVSEARPRRAWAIGVLGAAAVAGIVAWSAWSIPGRTDAGRALPALGGLAKVHAPGLGTSATPPQEADGVAARALEGASGTPASDPMGTSPPAPPDLNELEDRIAPTPSTRARPDKTVVRSRAAGPACYFSKDKNWYLTKTARRQEAVLVGETCFVCWAAKRTDNLSAPKGVTCQAHMLCGEETPDKCRG